ncbi:MAG: hypothetical protein NTZ35_09190 [Ignavibacteriales bacterium]|nr:hypothetical protein [Ignavibacteriales bacterium]
MPSSSNILTDILHRLSATRKRQHSVELRANILSFCTIVILALVAATLLELGFRLDSSGRTAVFFFIFALTGLLFLWYVGRPVLKALGVLRSADDFELATIVGASFPQIHDRLLNLLQLHQEIVAGKSLYSPELVDASFQDLADNIRDLDFTASINTSPVLRSVKLFAVSFFGSLLLVFASPGQFVDSLFRIIHYNREFVSPAEFALEVTPGNSEVIKGQTIQIAVRVQTVHLLPEATHRHALGLFWRLEGTKTFEHAELRPDSAGVYRTTFQNIRGTTEYYATISNAESQRYKLTVVDRPVFRSFQVRLDYPGYTKLPPKVQDEFIGDVTALAGTKITLSGIASKDLRGGTVVFGTGAPLSLAINNQKFSASFRLETETDYHIHVNDTENLANADPIRYQLKIIPDESPTVALLQPGRNTDLTGDPFLRLLIQAKDDFGISALRIGYRMVHSRYEKPWESPRFVSIALPSGISTELELPYTWDLTPLHLVPEDVIEYYAEVFDNDAVRGPKSGKSQTFLIRLPSLEEVFAEVDKGHEASLDDMKQALQDAKQLKEKIESVNQDMKKNKEMDWQQQKKLEEMSKKYQELQKKLDNVQNKLSEMVQKMDQQKVLSKETMEKYQELQQMFEQLNSAELQQALKQMQQAMQNLNKEQLQQAMQKLTFSEDQFRQSIERTIELLKRIQIEQKIDEARKRAQELEQTQKDLSQETSKAANDEQKRGELAKKQNDLVEKQHQLERETSDVQKRMEEFFTEMPADRMQKLNAQMQEKQLGQKMNQAGKQMQSGQLSQAQQTQQQVEQELHEQANELQSIQQEMLQKQMQQTLNALRRATNDMLELSKREESLKQQAQAAPTNSPQLRQNAQDQMRAMQDMQNVIRGLGELSKRSFAVTPEIGRSIGEAMAHMQSSLEALEGRNGYGASQEEGQSMSSLNKTATQLQSAMQNMMQQSGGSGMGGLMQQLQMMAGQQQSINMQTQSMQQAADAARLAVEQEAVRKSLEQLNKEAQASGEQKKMLGDLDKIADEMREVVQNLAQNNVNPETLRKQERILSRLLDASKSMRERDYEKKRKATTGTQVARRGPGDLDPSLLEGKNKLLEDLLKSLEHGYSKDYQELIRKYFDALQKLEMQKQ